MMIVARAAIAGWLRGYDQKKGLRRRLFGDQRAIKELKWLLAAEQGFNAITDEDINRCFRQHPVKLGSESYKVFDAFRVYRNMHVEVQPTARPREAVATRQPVLAPVSSPPTQDVNPHDDYPEIIYERAELE